MAEAILAVINCSAAQTLDLPGWHSTIVTTFTNTMTLTQAPPAKTTADSNIWRTDDGFDPDAFAAKKHGKSDAYDPDIQDAIEAHINASSDKLRKLSVDIHGKPNRTSALNIPEYVIDLQTILNSATKKRSSYIVFLWCTN